MNTERGSATAVAPGLAEALIDIPSPLEANKVVNGVFAELPNARAVTVVEVATGKVIAARMQPGSEELRAKAVRCAETLRPQLLDPAYEQEELISYVTSMKIGADLHIVKVLNSGTLVVCLVVPEQEISYALARVTLRQFIPALVR